MQDLAPILLAAIAAFGVDWASERKGLLPTAFGFDPTADGFTWFSAALRRGIGFLILTGLFWIAVFGPLGRLGNEVGPDLSDVPLWQLFLGHLVLLWGLALWLLLGYGVAGRASDGRIARELGLSASDPLREVGVGLAGGVVAWLLVIVAVLALTGLIWAIGAEDLLPPAPPEFVIWVVGLPVIVRLGLSLSAGVVEELFFRGFLQPRIGLGLSSLFFVVAHLNYGQPLMLVGVALLSVFFGLLVRWRRSIWAAVAAHFLFDAIQLLIVIPKGLELIPQEAAGAALIGGLARVVSGIG